MLFAIYKTAMSLSAPLLEAFLRERTLKGKEDAARAHERRGRPILPRPPSPLVWFHAASVGEAMSLLSVIARLLKDYHGASVMVTTGTVTSAKLMAERLPPGAFHQYIPVDHPRWVEGFLDHWHPDVAVWAESEFWPNMLAGIKRRGIPALLLNARMSEATFAKWRFARGMIGGMLSAFDACLAQNGAEAARLSQLGARGVKVSTNLKYAAAPLPFDAAALEDLKRKTAERTLLLWASTHPCEEEIALALHKKLQAQKPDLLTVIVPRHPKRGEEFAGRAALRSRGEDIAEAQVYIADTLGELGLFYRLCKNVVMGGTFARVGGHNPIEPAQSGCTVFCGPEVYNFITIVEDFKARNAIVLVKDAEELAGKIADAWQNPAAYDAIGQAAQRWTAEKSHVVDEVAEALAPLLARVLR